MNVHFSTFKQLIWFFSDSFFEKDASRNVTDEFQTEELYRPLVEQTKKSYNNNVANGDNKIAAFESMAALFENNIQDKLDSFERKFAENAGILTVIWIKKN